MMSDEFVTFQRFSDKSLAEKLSNLLEKSKIEYQFEDNSSSLDSSFGGGGFTNEYVVKLRKGDFEKANFVLIEDSISDLDSIDKEYYLFSFTDDELRDVIAHEDEWNKFDFLLAQKLLGERGIEISAPEIKAFRENRLKELAEPEKTDMLALALGYLFALMGGFLGILIGWYIKSNRKTLPNGDRVYTYSKNDRGHGRAIMGIGIGMMVAWTAMIYFMEGFARLQG